MTHRQVPTLTVAQEEFLSGIETERFSLENAVKMYAYIVKPGATGVVVHTYKNSAAYETEVLRGEGSTVAVDTVPAAELRPKKAQI